MRCLISKGWRCEPCRVSGNSHALAASSTTPTPVRNQNTACQLACTNRKPPMMGATAGATPKNSVTWDITRWACAGGERSRMTAPEAVRQRAMEQAHEGESKQVGRQRLLDLDGRCVQVGGDAREGRQVGVDGERPEHAERRQQHGHGPAWPLPELVGLGVHGSEPRWT